MGLTSSTSSHIQTEKENTPPLHLNSKDIPFKSCTYFASLVYEYHVA